MFVRMHNKTRWSTNDLRALYKAALVQAGASGRTAVLTVSSTGEGKRAHQRGGVARRHVRGCAYLGSHRSPGAASIWLPEPERCAAFEIDPVEFRDVIARVLHHEALHAVGARHADMTEEQHFTRQPVPWVANLPLNPKPALERPKPTRAAAFQDKLEHVRAMLGKARTRAKRAATIEKKWARRLRMLERKQVSS